jgi:hypothetical protein
MDFELGAVDVVDSRIKNINIKNASDILSKGTKAQITHLFNVYNALAKKGGAALLTPAELQGILSSRGFKGYGAFGDWWDTALKIGNGIANIGAAVGPVLLQKYQIDKMPSAVPATPAAVAAESRPAVTKGTDWTTVALYGGVAAVVGGLAYIMFFKKKK